MLDCCSQLVMATEIILALARNESMSQVVLLAKPEIVKMAIKSFDLEWEVVRDGDSFTIVRKVKGLF